MQRGKDLNAAVQAIFFRGGARAGEGEGALLVDLCGSSLRLGVSGLSGLRVWMLIKKISGPLSGPVRALGLLALGQADQHFKHTNTV